MQTKQDKPNADTEVFCAEIGLMLSLQLVGTLGCDVFALGAQFRVAARVVHTCFTCDFPDAQHFPCRARV